MLVLNTMLNAWGLDTWVPQSLPLYTVIRFCQEACIELSRIFYYLCFFMKKENFYIDRNLKKEILPKQQ